MANPALSILFPKPLEGLARSLLRQQSRRSAALRLGTFSPTGRMSYYRAYNPSAGRTYYSGRHDWNRITVPQYGSLSRTIPGAEIIVPAGMRFSWENYSDLPTYLPSIKLAPTRKSTFYERNGLPLPDWEMQIATAPPRLSGSSRLPPEFARRRHDSKVPFFYNRFLSILNRTYGPYTEFMEFNTALQMARSPVEFATIMALNQAIDIAYGRRARFLKQKVYNSGKWPFPVGYDALSRLWR